MGSGHSSHPQPQVALGSDGITPGSVQDTRVPVASVPEDLLPWWAPSPMFSPPLCPPCHLPLSHIPCPLVNLGLFGHFVPSPHMRICYPPPLLKMLKELGQCWTHRPG